ncbi:MAG: hypothetical protein DMG07_27660, partial [Acidobacteria bacterium]
MTTNPADLRRNVRAKLNLPVVLTGTDRQGRSFKVTGQSTDFSRKGVGVVLEQDVLTQGLAVNVSSGVGFRGIATVQWIGRNRDTGRVQVGLRLVEAKAGAGLKLAASLLLFFAFLNQVSFGQARGFSRAAPAQAAVSLSEPAAGAAIGAAEEEGSWVQEAIAKAAAAQPNSRRATVNLRLTKESYAPGETVAVSGYRLSNPSTSSQTLELKTWMSGPGVAPISVGNVGADGLYVLAPGSDEEYGSMDLLRVSPDMLGGKGEFGARILDPVTGETVGETTRSFTLATSSGNSGAARNHALPSLAVECQVGSSSYRSGDTVELAAYRIVNQGTAAATIEAKVWLEAPGLAPMAVFSL